ncbi:hypothetical protein MKX03_027647 [Papaver bracteatum]|nr:hypothetical protein MKX03_027647 [Papaver bracteatum]
MSTDTMQTPGSVCWGDLEDDGQDLNHSLLPPPVFGDAVHEDVGARLTMVSTEEIRLERPQPRPRPPDGARQLGSEMRPRRNEENSVRVTNLSEETREPDLLEMFRRFGTVSRVYIPVDRRTGVSRGFAFVNFVNKEDAERAINVLNDKLFKN